MIDCCAMLHLCVHCCTWLHYIRIANKSEFCFLELITCELDHVVRLPANVIPFSQDWIVISACDPDKWTPISLERSIISGAIFWTALRLLGYDRSVANFLAIS